MAGSSSNTQTIPPPPPINTPKTVISPESKGAPSGQVGVVTQELQQGDDVKTIVPHINEKLRNERVSGTQRAVVKHRSTDFLNAKLRTKYANLSDIGTGLHSREDWEDSNLTGLEHLNIQGYQRSSLDERCVVMKKALEAVCSKVSAGHVGTILAGAWLLASPEDVDSYVFKPVEMAGKAVDINTLSSTITADTNETLLFKDIVDKQRFLREGSFLCSVLLRLVTKEASNVKKAWKGLKTSYINFYQEDMSMDLEPSDECLEAIRNTLQNRTIVKNTVALFLLNIKNLEGQDLGLCRMLFEIHLSYTGMHSYNLLLFCSSTLKVPLRTFFQLFEHPAHHEALQAAAKLLTVYEFPQSEESQKVASEGSTWKYARIFDSTVFAALQTKNCSQLTALLATLAKKIGGGQTGDVTKIKQIASVCDSNAEFLGAASERILDYCRRAAWAPEEELSGVFKDIFE